MHVKIRCYSRYTHQHSYWHLWPSKFAVFHWSFWKFERILHLKRPCNDSFIRTMYLHHQHEQNNIWSQLFSNESISIGHMLIPYSCKFSLGKEIAIVLFLPFLRNFSCNDVFTLLLTSTVTIWDGLAPQTWCLTSLCLVHFCNY